MLSTMLKYGIFAFASVACATPYNMTGRHHRHFDHDFFDPCDIPEAPSTSSTCMRGIPYANVHYTTAFVKTKVSWAYNWESSPGNLSTYFDYVPMLWATGEVFTSVWQTNVNKAIAAGSTHLLGFNEPDLPQQAHLSPAAAATGYRTYLSNMFGGKNIRLGSPAVSNGPAPHGLTWLKAFMTACSGCQIDFVAIHWYASANSINYFKEYVQQAHNQTSKPIWITEFGVTGSDEEINTFLTTVLPWLKLQPYVERVAYFMARNGLLNNGTGLSSYGKTYATLL